MKILREKSRTYKGKHYFKYKINIPEEVLKDAGFKAGDDLDVKVKKGEIRLRRV